MFKRASKSITQRKIKNLIFLMLATVLATFASLALSIGNAIDSTAVHLRRSLPHIVSVTQDFEKLEAAGYTLLDRIQGNVGVYLFQEPLTREMIYEIGALPYVRYFQYSVDGGAVSFELEPYEPEFLGEQNDVQMLINSVLLTGIPRPIVAQLEMGLWDLESGRLFTEEEMLFGEVAPVLISRGMADTNDLSLGSIVTLYIFSYFVLPEDANVPEGGFVGLTLEEVWEHPYNVHDVRGFEFEIVGLFDAPYEPTNDRRLHDIHRAAMNQFITPVWRVEEINHAMFDNHMKWVSVFNQEIDEDAIGNWRAIIDSFDVQWILYDLDDFDSFKQKADLILPEYLVVEDMSFLQEHAINSMGSVEVIARQTMFFTVGATVIILTLLVLLYLRDRKHEIGVYLALGEKKAQIAAQILFETLAVATIGIVLATFISYIISDQISNILLRDAFLQSQGVCLLESVLGECWEPTNHLSLRGFGSKQMEVDEMMEMFDISLDLKTTVTFYSAGLTTVLLSTIVPIIYIMELNPKELLLQSKIG